MKYINLNDEVNAKILQILDEHENDIAAANKALEELYNEQQEGKDEKIRKALIEHIRCNKDLNWSLFQWFTPTDIITWLEKQKGD